MIQALQDDLLEYRRDIYRPTPRRTVVEWCEENMKLSARQTENPGPFSTANRPYMRELLENWKDPSVTEVTACWGVQTAKTTSLLAGATWSICEDPSPMLWLMPSENLARSFSKTRWMPGLEDCDRATEEFPSDRDKLTNLEQHFRHCTLNFIGSNSASNLASRPIRILIADEIDKFAEATEEEDDALVLAEQRVRAFGRSKVFLTSTPTVVSGRIWQRFLRGDQRRYYVPCPHCTKRIKFIWSQVKWADDARRPDRTWDLNRVQSTAHYQCQMCGGAISDAQKVAILRLGEWVPENPHAVPGVRSYHLPSMYSPDRKCTWGAIAVRFLEAKASRIGLHGFINGDLAEPWSDELGEIDDFEFLEHRCDEYSFGDPWPEERMRLISADKQIAGGEHYWWVVRAFGEGGKSRLIAYGRANSLLELEDRRKSYNVPVSNAVIDSGFRAAEVYRFCRAAGWKAFKGDDAEYFLHKDERTKKVFRRLWDRTLVDPAIGTRRAGRVAPMRLYRWSNPGVKDLLAEYLKGLSGDWTLPRKVGRDYLAQLSAERRVEERDSRGFLRYRWHQVRRDNHLLDCELQAMVVAILVGLVPDGIISLTE